MPGACRGLPGPAESRISKTVGAVTVAVAASGEWTCSCVPAGTSAVRGTQATAILCNTYLLLLDTAQAQAHDFIALETVLRILLKTR